MNGVLYSFIRRKAASTPFSGASCSRCRDNFLWGEGSSCSQEWSLLRFGQWPPPGSFCNSQTTTHRTSCKPQGWLQWQAKQSRPGNTGIPLPILPQCSLTLTSLRFLLTPFCEDRTKPQTQSWQRGEVCRGQQPLTLKSECRQWYGAELCRHLWWHRATLEPTHTWTHLARAHPCLCPEPLVCQQSFQYLIPYITGSNWDYSPQQSHFHVLPFFTAISRYEQHFLDTHKHNIPDNQILISTISRIGCQRLKRNMIH